MSIGAIVGLGLLAVGVTLLFIWATPAITEAARRRKRENDIELQDLKTAANEAEVTSQAAAFDMLRQEVRPGERATYDGYIRAGGRLIGTRKGVMEYANPASGGGPLPAVAPSAPANPLIVVAGMSLARATTVALATTAVPPVTYPVGTLFPQGSATSPAGTQDNLEDLAAALVGLPALTAPVVDSVRDALAIAGTIKP